MTDQIKDVAKFHCAAKVVDGEQTPEVLNLRRKLCEEEAREFALAMGFCAPPWEPMESMVGGKISPDVNGIADASADLAYVTLGTLIHLFGEAAARRVWNEVQRSNMAKFGPGSWKNEDGKQMKPEGWTPPDIAGAIAGTIPSDGEVDKINPPRYDGDACMRAIARATYAMSGAAVFCVGQAIKYLWRAGKKASETARDDCAKAVWYLEWLRAHPDSHERGHASDEERLARKIAKLEDIIGFTAPELWREKLETL